LAQRDLILRPVLNCRPLGSNRHLEVVHASDVLRGLGAKTGGDEESNAPPLGGFKKNCLN
jgi:hypothetical protein